MIDDSAEPSERGGVHPRHLTNRTVLNAVSATFILADTLLAFRLQPLPAALLVLGCAAALILIFRTPSLSAHDALKAPLDPFRFGLCLLLAFAILLFGGEAHFFYSNTDWLVRDSVLADLIHTPDMPSYTSGNAHYIMRAPIGMYLLPAWVGVLFGLLSAHVALLLQNTFLLGAILYLINILNRGWSSVAVLLVFGGASLIWRIALAVTMHRPELLLFNAIPLDQWHPYLQYSGSITQLFWVPNHALPGWWVAVLLLLLSQSEIDVAVVAVSVASLVIWSPLAILPAVPCVLVLVADRLPRTLSSIRTWLGVAACAAFLPVAVYVVVGAGTIAHGLVSERPHFLSLYVIFTAIELPAAMFVAIKLKDLEPKLRRLFWVSIGILLLLPLFSFGPGNDLVMRASITALVIVALCFTDVLFGARQSHGPSFLVGLAILLMGCFPAVAEFARAVRTPAFRFSNCSVMEGARALRTGTPTNYVVADRAMPTWLVRAPSHWPPETASRACWPDLVAPS